MDMNRKEHIRGTAEVEHCRDKLRKAGLRWFGCVQRRKSGHSGDPLKKNSQYSDLYWRILYHFRQAWSSLLLVRQ